MSLNRILFVLTYECEDFELKIKKQMIFHFVYIFIPFLCTKKQTKKRFYYIYFLLLIIQIISTHKISDLLMKMYYS
jgi:hypothetical protein